MDFAMKYHLMRGLIAIKIFLFLSLFSFSVFATTMRVPPSANVSTEGLHTVVDMVKQGGDHVQTARGAAAAERALAANGALRNQHALNIAAQNARRGVSTTSPMPASSLAKKAIKVGGAIGTATLIICTAVDILSGKSCEQRKTEGIKAIKDWFDHGALGTDPEGNPTSSVPSCEHWISGQSGITYSSQSQILAECVRVYHPDDISTITLSGSVANEFFCDRSGTHLYQLYCINRLPDVSEPISVDLAVDSLAKTPISPSDKDKIAEVLDEVATQKKDQSYQPEADDPVIDDGDYTDKSPSDESSRTTPDGKIVDKKDQIDCFKTGSARLECQKVTIEKTTYPDGSTSNDVTAKAPTAEELGFTEDKPKSSGGFDCNFNPELIMCSKWGTLPVAEKLTPKEVPITIDNKSLGAGTCPAPKVINLSSGRTMSLSYQPECDFASKIKPIILAFSWLAAGFIVIGGAKES
jgi:hypothetical protein